MLLRRGHRERRTDTARDASTLGDGSAAVPANRRQAGRRRRHLRSGRCRPDGQDSKKSDYWQ